MSRFIHLRSALLAALAITVLAASGCINIDLSNIHFGNKPLPDDRLAYAGTWKAESMRLTITEDGRVDYARKGHTTTTVTGPIKEFKGDDIVVGFWFLTTTFSVQKPPHTDGGQWKMTVDGVELTRTLGGPGSPVSI